MPERVERELGGHAFSFSNPNKVLFPDDGITKADLVDYHERIADAMLRHLSDRPVTLERYPDGIDKKSFFQKDASKHFPDWIRRVEMPKAKGTVNHVLVDNAAALAYLAGQAAITFHVWLSRCDKPFHPDRLVFDLDPSTDDFGEVRAAAFAFRDVLDDLGLARYVQTTGSRGLHVVVPLDRSADIETVRGFAEDLAEVVAHDAPDRFTTAFRKDEREGRLFLDVMRNGYAQTMVSPYSVRPKPGAPVATPLEWDELDDTSLDARRFNVRNVIDRVEQGGDPWADINRHAHSLTQPRKKLDALRAERL